MTPKQLQNAFRRWSDQGKALVLASVYETEGSTYSKAGAQMLITGDGDFQGMLSGGCLEGDLAERARAVLESGSPQSVTYDLGQNDEELWGLGVGCDGLMRIFLQAVSPDNQYQPFATMCTAYEGGSAQVAATVLDSEIDALPAGSTLVTIDGDVAFSDIGGDFAQMIQAEAPDVPPLEPAKGRLRQPRDVVQRGLHRLLLPPVALPHWRTTGGGVPRSGPRLGRRLLGTDG